jgi:predicted RNA binding protein YcfA (HicA-like mRNA interferase family)
MEPAAGNFEKDCRGSGADPGLIGMPKIGPIHWKEFEKFLFHAGCRFTREKGDHRIYWKEGVKRPIVIPRDSALPQFIILNNLRVLGISREEYLAFFDK